MTNYKLLHKCLENVADCGDSKIFIDIILIGILEVAMEMHKYKMINDEEFLKLNEYKRRVI